MIRLRLRTASLVLLVLACMVALGATPGSRGIQPDYGILLMAHGGDEAWNARVVALAEEVGRDVRVEVAFGMADRATLQRAVHRLEADGGRRIVVVRLFVSGESFRAQTEYLLGLRSAAPSFLIDSGTGGGHHAGHDPDAPILPILHGSEIVLTTDGLVDDPLIGRIVAERALALSRDPSRETVLLLAHGMGDPAANQALLAALDARASDIRTAAPFRRVLVDTLREDWKEERRAAERRIRAAVRAAGENGRALVIPFRVTGFGPYAAVLEGLEYSADGVGLLPHPFLGEWVRARAAAAAERAGWTSPVCCDSASPF